MRALSLHQPWAHFVCTGLKISETRSWAPPLSLVMTGQRIAIHATRKRADPLLPVVQLMRLDTRDLAAGAIVATAVVSWFAEIEKVLPGAPGEYATVRYSTVTSHGRDVPALDDWADPYGDWRPGRWVWGLRGVRALDCPVRCPGRRRLWTVPPDVAMRVRAATWKRTDGLERG